ncbi:MAG: sugar phosphate isomerase/epimerase [Lachnospiraceae bacterium]|nr:sugar phosphate isomerase/epimerase [Lachnospiraceae bacterium]
MIDKTVTVSRNLIQVQPVRTAREEWKSLAESEGLGYEVLELSMPPALNESGLFDSCVKWYRESGRAGSIHGNFIDVNPGSGDKKFRELSFERCRESCRAAALVGAENIVFHSSCNSFLRGAYMEGWSALCAGFFDTLADESGLNIFIENSPDVDPEPLKNLMSVKRSPLVGVCLDLGHANYSRVGLDRWFSELGEYIGYLHLSDNMGEFDDHLPLGKGTVDWKEAHRLWKALGKATPMTLEVGGIDSVRASLAFLREHHYFE